MTRRALITGAAGFAGRHLARRLEGNGWATLCSDREGEGCVPCDFGIAGDIDALIDGAGDFTHVFHLAARTFVPESMSDPSGAFQVNLLGTVHLLARLSRMPVPPRVVFISSAEAYGPPLALPVDEQHPLAPQNPYAVSKAAADQYCAYLSRVAKLEIIRVRPFNHSGAGQTSQFVLSSFARQVARIEAGKSDPVLQVGNLDARRDFSHVADVMAAYEMLALHGVPGEAYNVCSGDVVRVGDALEMLLARSAAAIRVETDPARMRPVEVAEIRGSNEKLRQLGWAPDKAFGDILDDLLGYWRKQEAVAT
ncbi:MAG: hypothetical protein RLZZ303_210 [Candidatus Hydrogenedentota bacterium]|jgi:GDP-4-dehydro-6-deoxy-D-mannose reductase